MTSKTFKSALDSPVTLEVERETHPAGVYLTIGQATILLGASDAPALALAILEAAGVEAFGAGYLNKAVDCLQLHAREQERATAEATERAELEAEALELFNAAEDVPARVSEPAVESFEGMPRYVRERWLAVARRAREIGGRAEK